MILLRKVTLNRIEWDPSILDHLSFALSVSGDLMILANQLEELLPGTIHRKERFHALALCYYGAGKNVEALDLLRKLLSNREDPRHVPSLLMASKICCENFSVTKDPGVSFARMALENLDGRCNQLENMANFLLGVSLSAYSKFAISDAERVKRQSEALHTLENACKLSRMEDPVVLYHLSLEYAEQRKLDAALHYAKCIVKLEVGSNVKGWLLLSRVLSAQKRFLDAESIINAALDQTGKWDQGDLLRTKAKLQIAQGQLKSAIETYTQLLAVLQVHMSQSFTLDCSMAITTSYTVMNYDGSNFGWLLKNSTKSISGKGCRASKSPVNSTFIKRCFTSLANFSILHIASQHHWTPRIDRNSRTLRFPKSIMYTLPGNN
ncbi:hypothetical protein AHAS_Ahas18G0251200 [Arachis hypogaea]